MNKILSYISFLILIGLTFSCNKEATPETNLEGTWGLVSFERCRKIDGVIQSQEKGECNPYDPSGVEDRKITVKNISGNNYLMTTFFWDIDASAWKPDDTVNWTIKGDNIYEGDGNTIWNTYWFSLSGDTLIVELNDEHEDPLLLNHVMVQDYYKDILKKMD